MKRRIFLESDILHDDELRSVQRNVYHLLEKKGEPFIKEIFDETLDLAWHDLDKTWKAVKAADEIYADSSLMPLVSNSYMGAPVIFNGMMERAIKEGITGKDVYILRPLKDIDWYMIEVELMSEAFKNNRLFMYDDDYNEMILVDIASVVEEQKEK